MIEIILDTQTNEIIEKPYSDAQLEEARQWAEQNQAKIAEAEAKAAARQALLAKLGITEEEAKLLFS